jgi:hypothetical protein
MLWMGLEPMTTVSEKQTVHTLDHASTIGEHVQEQ